MPAVFDADTLIQMLNLTGFEVERVRVETVTEQSGGRAWANKEIYADVHPFKEDQSRCPVCKEPCVRNGFKQERASVWRAPNFYKTHVFLSYRPQRIYCPRHGALNEYIPWADGTSRFTAAFNDEIAWMTTQISNNAICEFEDVNWRTVANCVKAARKRGVKPDTTERLRDLRRIWIDEIRYKGGNKHITAVYDCDRDRVVWIHESHGREVYEEFCKAVPEEERGKVEIVAGGSASWIDDCMSYFPNAARSRGFLPFL